MDFSFSPEHEALRDTVRRFCAEHIAPRARQASCFAPGASSV